MPRPKGAYASRNQTFKRCKYGAFKDGDRMRCLRNPKHNQKVQRTARMAALAQPARAVARRRRVIPAAPARRSARIANKPARFKF